MNNKYPYLPEGKEIKYVGLDNPYMKKAKEYMDKYSTDMSHPTGAVVVKNDVIIGMAANKSAINNKKLLTIHKDYICVRRILKIKTGTKYWLCPGCASFRYHAESGSVKDAISKGNNPMGADLYLYGHWWCCKPCWDEMIKGGIKNVYLLDKADELFK